MKKIMIWVMLVLAAPVFGQKNILNKTSVLFVGYDPAKALPEIKRMAPGMMSAKDFIAQYPSRMPAFKELLSRYFSTVKTIDCRDWKPEDSQGYDVTVFDFPTSILEPEKREKLESGKIENIPARYLPDNFDKPVIFIANTADVMGRKIGLKLDWLCLCLDADAHHVNANHAIFKGQLEKVNPTLEQKKTPEGIFHYSTGANVPKEIPMWRVQKTSYSENKGARVGLVARGNRFAESPDTETISSGVCLKDVGAVALGRHGNFFLWGFGASPLDMTDEAKKVFVNAVAYMKQFDGKIPIARKFNDRMATTDDVIEIIANATKEKYNDYVKEIQSSNSNRAVRGKLIKDKKAAGQALTPEEEAIFPYIDRVQEVDTYEQYLKKRMGNLSNKFGNDASAFRKYLTENLKYVYCNPAGSFEYSIDEDVKHVGISNHDVKLLEKCVTMLAANDQPELASRVLKRYTNENFISANDWRNWLSQNRSKLFFTETGGYKFMINTYSK
ncbi:hypothetical protein [Pedobacter sp. BMA]|uniref:hypothetical protein n=1 Tax=Pedobacter sp. BMA TaxID=1663685 RepID=UPI0006493A16|nr:hypothetical protein [Pedobacter sp. BMA]KLT67065.1 hypothetical protein AB669_03955 [Pedobacter sp. BMA]